MKKWDVKRYTKYCQDTNEGLNDEAEQSGCDIGEIAFEVAQSCLENEEGLKEFLKAKFPRVTDYRGMMADDICYPGNCRNYK